MKRNQIKSLKDKTPAGVASSCEVLELMLTSGRRELGGEIMNKGKGGKKVDV